MVDDNADLDLINRLLSPAEDFLPYVSGVLGSGWVLMKGFKRITFVVDKIPLCVYRCPTLHWSQKRFLLHCYFWYFMHCFVVMY